MVDTRTDVAHNARAHGHHNGHRGEVTPCFQERGSHKEETDKEQRGRGAISGHQLRRIVVQVIDQNVLRIHARRIPGNELVAVAVNTEEHLQHRNERQKRKDIEHGRKQVENQRTDQITFIRRHIAPHDAEKFFHNVGEEWYFSLALF